MLLVDLDNGRVAHVPARQKMTWNTDHYAIAVEQAMIDDMPTLDPGIQPSWIRKGDLAILDEEFGVEPYWKD